MTKYKCGHETDFIITSGDIMAITTWITWKESVGFEGNRSQCWECYCKDNRKGDK